jgi:hypothetical protein
MAITPNTVVHFLNVPLENNYKNQIDFTDRATQTAYMISKKIEGLTFENLTFQRKDNVIRVPKHIDSLWDVNYVMYQNADHNNRWFYAFVTKMEYINDGRTDVYIETDVWQTWFDRITLKPSFVEREHVEDDTVGKHINGEGLQLGDYVCNFHTKAGYDDGTMKIVVGVTKTPNGDKVRGTSYNGIYSGLRYYSFNQDLDGIKALENWIKEYSGDGANEAIQCMFLVPRRLVNFNNDDYKDGENILYLASPSEYHINHHHEITPGDINVLDYVDINMSRNHLDGYVPKNMKLMTYPYRYLMVSNNNGLAIPFEYEQFYTEDENKVRTIIDPKFTVKGCITPGGSIRMIPENYKGIETNDEEGINLGKYPALNWTSDYFTNWLTQNGVNIGVSIFSDVVQTGLGVAGALLSPATGGMSALMGAGAVAGGVTGISNTMGEIYKAYKTPPQSQGNVNCGDVVTASGQNDFHFYDMSIKRQFAEILDNFFEMFGYKVNTVKTPKLRTRPHWNYIKTIDVNIDGRIPQDDLTKVRAMFDNGITFWHDPNNVENYSLNNH